MIENVHSELPAGFWHLMMDMPMWFQIGMVIGIIALLFFIVKQGITIIRGGTSNNTKFGIRIGRQGQEIERRSPHQLCIHKQEIIVLFHRSKEIYKRKWMIENVGKIKEQITYAEQKADQIRQMFLKAYLNELAKKQVLELVDSTSYKAYNLCLMVTQELILDILRTAFKENHFGELQPKAFDDYKEDKMEFLISKATEFLNALYYYQEDIKRSELYNLNQDVVPKASKLIEEIFEKARDIAIDDNIKILACNEEMSRIQDEVL